jgi:hypothetical protein
MGDPETVITVTGSLFIPNQAIKLYWDQESHVSGVVDADRNGNFTWKLKPYPGDAPGLHKLCANVAPNPCATFTLQAAVTTPSPSASPSPDPTPSSSPTVAPPARINSRLNGLDVILKPPFVILPIIGGVGLVIALMYWVLSMFMRPRPPQTLKSVTVGHRASRPDYAAGFGAPPVAPTPAAPLPSAWPHMPPTSPAVEVAGEAVAAEAPYVEIHETTAPAPQVPTSPAPEWTGEESGEPDPLLAAWADVLPPRGVESPPPQGGEGSPQHGTKPPASHDDPLDLPEPGD